jgi:hypothetical protein
MCNFASGAVDFAARQPSRPGVDQSRLVWLSSRFSPFGNDRRQADSEELAEL